MRSVMVRGAGWAIENGYGFADDLEVTEEHGCLAGADPDSCIGDGSAARHEAAWQPGLGKPLLRGTEVVDHIYDAEAARRWALARSGQIVVTIHCGCGDSGIRFAEDYVKLAESKAEGLRFPSG